MAVISLFEDGKEFELEDLDKVKTVCSTEVPFGYTVTLTDSRGLTNNKNIEQIVELFINSDSKLMFIIDEFDNIDDSTIDMLNGWITAYRDMFRIGVVLKKGISYNKLYEVKDSSNIMPLLILGEGVGIKETIDLIVEKRMNRLVFLELPRKSIIPYSKIAKEIIEINDYRKANDVGIWLGCGFTMCMFGDEGIGKLFNSPLVNFTFFCSPKVIIKPDMKAYYCGKLDYSIDINSLYNIIEAHVKLEEQKLKTMDSKCIMNEKCWSYRKTCGGGCLYNK